MNRRYLIWPVIVISMIFVVSGCETTPKRYKEEMSTMKTKVDTLESRVQGIEGRQEDVERRASEHSQALDELKVAKERHVKMNIGAKCRSFKGRGRTKKIQVCLKNAGFYKGEIDGIKGKATKQAIKEFQKANGLAPDGRVGGKTWELLRKYAEGAAAQSAGPVEEGAVK